MNTAQARARFVSDGLAVLTAPRLLLALYERLVRDLDDASAAIRSGSLMPAHHALLHAQDIVSELTLALDGTQWEGAGDLTELYEWTYPGSSPPTSRRTPAPVDSASPLSDHCAPGPRRSSPAPTEPSGD
jgi:hypothetical protein